MKKKHHILDNYLMKPVFVATATSALYSYGVVIISTCVSENPTFCQVNVLGILFLGTYNY